ncbi:hypothetical protein [Deinococcus deserti]|uniref:Uncharacterized protein n=1 Tax=Deinococcus deserti (strain DSM 17065 / CIP 109153 / LMG 22923 / VCD115) TaxID=546414 RepID=X5H5M5_DEIDV|nr:hypothetical protein [Deinococcus deserti]AHX26493.1 hypothetical protein Deide_07352 [Deinococcus deserti VCD115]
MSDRQYGRPSRVIMEWDEVETDTEHPTPAAAEATPAAQRIASPEPAAAGGSKDAENKGAGSSLLKNIFKGLRRTDK